MTIEEAPCNELAFYWKEYVKIFYYSVMKESFEDVLQRSQNEGISDLNCIVFKLPIDLDFSHLIEFNPEFYDYFNTASPEELKGLVRESSVEILQEIAAELNCDAQIDKRQISIEIYMKNVPCTSDVLLESFHVYLSAIPRLCTENLELKGSWESRPSLLAGKIVSVSDPIYLSDIQTFTCTNQLCRNNQRIIRHVGLDHLEQPEELGPTEIKSEVFISYSSRNKTKNNNIIKCHNCREEINELCPFRSNVEFKVAKIQVHGSENKTKTCFTIDALIVGSKSCSELKLSESCALIGFPKLSAEIPFQLKCIASQLRSHYFEVYGINSEQLSIPKNINGTNTKNYLRDILEWFVDRTSERLRFLLLVMLCQVIGSINGIHFNINIPGIDEIIINRISKLFNFYFDSKNIISSLISNMINFKTSLNGRINLLKANDEFYPNHVNIITSNTNIPKSNAIKSECECAASFIFIEKKSRKSISSLNFDDITIPVELSSIDEAEIIINQTAFDLELINANQIVSNRQHQPIQLSNEAAKALQTYFLSVRSTFSDLPLKSTLSLLTKLTKISALTENKTEASLSDAEFSTMIHITLLKLKTHPEKMEHDNNNKFDYNYQIMSPSTSFEYYNEKDFESINIDNNNNNNYMNINTNQRLMNNYNL